MIEPQFIFCSMATLYLGGTLAYCGYMVTERGLLLSLGKGSWVVAFFLHSLFLTFSFIQAQRLPTFGLFEASLFFAWSIVLAAYLSTFRYRLRLLGAFVLPIVFLLILIASFKAHDRLVWIGSFSNAYFACHTVFLFLSYAAFALTFATAFMYLVLERQIKKKTIGKFYRWLPSLELLEEANTRFLGVGVIGYSLGIFFGLLWSHAALGYWVGQDPKVVLSFLTWGLYGSLFLGQMFHRVYGRKGMVLSVLFFWIIVTFVGVQHPTMYAVLGKA